VCVHASSLFTATRRRRHSREAAIARSIDRSIGRMDGSALGSDHVTRLGVPDNETCRARHRSHTRDRSRDVHACPRVRTSTPARYSRVDSPRPVRWNAVHGSAIHRFPRTKRPRQRFRIARNRLTREKLINAKRIRNSFLTPLRSLADRSSIDLGFRCK